MALIYLSKDMHLIRNSISHPSRRFNFSFLVVPVHEYENYSDLVTWKLSRQIENSLLCIAWTSYGGGN